MNIKTLCESVPDLAKARCSQLVSKAEFICKKFTKAFTKFGECHRLYDSGKSLSEREINSLGKCLTILHTSYIDSDPFVEKHIDDFMSFYRDSFPHATITPKLHLLEDHVVDFVKQYRVGFGFLGEQGAESIHAKFNGIRRNFVNMRNPVDRLSAILIEHLTQSSVPRCHSEATTS